MLKYVYEETRYLTRKNLLEELQTVNFVNPKKEEILKTFDVDLDSIDLDDVEATIKIDNYIKDIEIIFQWLDFDILDKEENIDINQKNQFLSTLIRLGINVYQEDILNLKNIMYQIRDNLDLIKELNKTNITNNSLKLILDKYNISYNEIDIENILKIINGIVYKEPIFLPTTRDKYYDENNHLISIIEVNNTKRNSTNLTNFEGEIYENLDFKTDLEAIEFVQNINSNLKTEIKTVPNGIGKTKDIIIKPHEIKEDFDSEFKTYIHFKGDILDEDWYDEIHIFKEKNTIIIKFGGLIPIVSRVPNESITSEEIKDVITVLETKFPLNEVSRYAIRELYNLKKVIEKRNYKKNENIIDINTLVKISSILADINYGDDRNIYFKTKIISSKPLKFKKEKTLTK